MRAIGVFLVLAILPLLRQAMDGMFDVSLASRILIYAIAATSLYGLAGWGAVSALGVGLSALALLVWVADRLWPGHRLTVNHRPAVKQRGSTRDHAVP